MLEFLKNSGINWAEVIVGIVSIVITGIIIPLAKSKLDVDKLKKARLFKSTSAKSLGVNKTLISTLRCIG